MLPLPQKKVSHGQKVRHGGETPAIRQGDGTLRRIKMGKEAVNLLGGVEKHRLPEFFERVYVERAHGS